MACCAAEDSWIVCGVKLVATRDAGDFFELISLAALVGADSCVRMRTLLVEHRGHLLLLFAALDAPALGRLLLFFTVLNEVPVRVVVFTLVQHCFLWAVSPSRARLVGGLSSAGDPTFKPPDVAAGRRFLSLFAFLST